MKALLASAVFWFYGAVLAGFVLIASGVYLLAGVGWACVCCGAIALSVAAVIRTGLIAHG